MGGPRYAGSIYAPPTVPQAAAQAPRPAPKKPGRASGVVLTLAVVAALIAGAAVIWNNTKSADERRTTEAKAKAAAEAAPSVFGPVYDSSAEGTGFHWKAPRSQINEDLKNRKFDSTVLEDVEYDAHSWGPTPRSTFAIIAFPSSVGADRDMEQRAAGLIFPDLEPTSTAPSGEVAGETGDETTYTSSYDDDNQNRVDIEVRAIAVSVRGALIVVIAQGALPSGVDQKELDRTLATIEYEPGKTVKDQAVEAGKLGLDDKGLKTVTDTASGLTWRAPDSYSTTCIDVSKTNPRISNCAYYQYDVGHEIYKVRVYPPSSGATQADVDTAAASFLDTDAVVNDTRIITIAGGPGVRYQFWREGTSRQMFHLFAAGAIDGAFVTVEVYRTDDEPVAAGEFDRLVGSFKRV